MNSVTRKTSVSKVFALAIFLMSTVFLQEGFAQGEYPNRPITIVVSYGAGGTSDVMTRTISKIAETELGQPIVVENRPGAAGLVGVQYVVSSKPDGYTLGQTSFPACVVVPHMQKVPFDVLNEVNPIMPICNVSTGLVVKADAPWNTYDDLLAYVRKNPGKFTYAISGVGTTPHITMERIAQHDGIKWTAIPFKSDADTALAPMGGNTSGGATSPLNAAPHIKAGKLKLLLVITETRWPESPEVPTMLEKGYGFCAVSHNFIFGQKGLPDPIKQKLERVFLKARQNPSYIEAARKFQMNTSTGVNSGKELAELIRKNHDEMGKVIKTLGIAEK